LTIYCDINVSLVIHARLICEEKHVPFYFNKYIIPKVFFSLLTELSSSLPPSFMFTGCVEMEAEFRLWAVCEEVSLTGNLLQM